MLLETCFFVFATHTILAVGVSEEKGRYGSIPKAADA